MTLVHRVIGLCFAAWVCCSASQASADRVEYRLGPQDKLKVRVFDWRAGTGDTHEWSALTGEFSVSAAGDVAFPIVGGIQASGKTPPDLAAALGEALQKAVGLAQAPYASVEVLQYRPFYILGQVAKPNEYPFRPGLTVLQAVGIAGGIEHIGGSSAIQFQRDAVATRGEIHVLLAERLQLLAKQARLEAEERSSDPIEWPAEVTAQASDPTVARAMREEELQLRSYRASLDAQATNLTRTKQLVKDELTSLRLKDEVVGRQMELVKTELALVTNLVARGLASSPRQIALQENQAQMDSGRIDLELAKVRASQDVARVDREDEELRNKLRSQALADLSDTRSRLATIDARMASLDDLVYVDEVRGPAMMAAINHKTAQISYRVTRVTDDLSQTFAAQENDQLMPGDTVVVEERPTESAVTANAR